MVLICWITDEELRGRTSALRDFYINEVLAAEGFDMEMRDWILSGRSEKRAARWFAQKRYQHEAVDTRKIAGRVNHFQGEDEL